MLALAALFVGCESPQTAHESWGKGAQPIIFGEDHRSEHGAIRDAQVLGWANATGSLFTGSDVSCAAERCSLKSAPYTVGTSDGAALPLCASEVFRGQPRAGYCSAFLVGPDLVATAGHCMLNQAQCEDARLVFGYTADARGEDVRTRVPASEVYSCVALVEHKFEGATALDDDWALFRLDRPVTGRTPLPVRRAGVVANEAELVMAGHPLGLPLKVTTSGAVTDNVAGRPKFSTSLDGSPGNSGSPVIDKGTGLVEGILTAGPSEEWSRASAPDGTECAAARICDAEGGCGGGPFPEWADATRVTGLAAAIAASAEPSAPAAAAENAPAEPSAPAANVAAVTRSWRPAAADLPTRRFRVLARGKVDTQASALLRLRESARPADSSAGDDD